MLGRREGQAEEIPSGPGQFSESRDRTPSGGGSFKSKEGEGNVVQSQEKPPDPPVQCK